MPRKLARSASDDMPKKRRYNTKPIPDDFDYPEETEYHRSEEELINKDNFKELTFDDIRPGYDVSVNDWLLRNNLMQQEIDLRVYKFKGENRIERVFCGRFIDHIPDEDELGRKYGSGRYECMLAVSDKNGRRRITSSKFTIDQIYDQYRREEQLRGGFNGVPQIQSVANGSDFDRMVESMAKLMSVMYPMLQQKEPSDYSSILMKSYENMGDIMRKNVLDQQQLISDLQRKNIGLPDLTETLEESTGLQGLLSQIAPWVDKLLPLIVGGGMKGKAAVQMVKSAPQYKEVVNDKRALAYLIKFVEEKHGHEVVKKLLSNLKLKRPRGTGVLKPLKVKEPKSPQGQSNDPIIKKN